MLKKNPKKQKNKDKRESLASFETSGLSHCGVVWAGWHSGFGIFKKYPMHRVKSGTYTLDGRACSAGNMKDTSASLLLLVERAVVPSFWKPSKQQPFLKWRECQPRKQVKVSLPGSHRSAGN